MDIQGESTDIHGSSMDIQEGSTGVLVYQCTCIKFERITFQGKAQFDKDWGEGIFLTIANE